MYRKMARAAVFPALILRKKDTKSGMEHTMLPNTKTQTANFKKLLKAQFGIEIKHHQAAECMARITGFSDYQQLLRGIEKSYSGIFRNKEIHCVASPCYFCGEDEVCYFLGQLLNLQKTPYFAAELRGWQRKFKGKQYNQSAYIFNSNDYNRIYDRDIGSIMNSDPNSDDIDLGCSSNELIVASPIFNEVMVFEDCDPITGQEYMNDYIRKNQFEIGIVSCGEMNRWKMIEGFDSQTDFSIAFHIPVSKNYITRDKPHIFKNLIQSIQKSQPNAPIFVWIFEDDCATDMHDSPRRVTITRNSPDEFLKAILDDLGQNKIQPIWIPHYSGTKCFIPHNGKILPQRIAERDRITLDILNQL